jgi:hypothetical protein
LLTHDHFEQLCAAAVTGQIKHNEELDLQKHLETCANCRDFVGDLRGVIGPAILECAEKRLTVKLPNGAEERFIAKAHSDGIPLGKKKRPLQAGRSKNHWGIALAAVAALIALLGILVYTKHLAEERRPPKRTTEVIQPQAIPVDNREAEDLRRESADLKVKLQTLQSQAEAVDSRLASYQDALTISDTRRAEMSSRINALETANGDLHKRLDDRNAQLAQLSGNVERLTSLKQANDIAVQTEESELNALREKVGLLTSQLQESEQLSRAANLAKDLIVARNLHIVDVNEADENGREQKPFGRIFYTEGKKLVFYAYDLTDSRQLHAKISFYVWGEKLGSNQPIKTLGVFHDDNKNEGRWVLTFDDQEVLAQIDSVFVTAETDKRPASQPGRRKILYAFLGNKPNHP